MKRRTFLKATLASAGALALGPACDSDDGGGTKYPDGAAFFPQSVASGDPSADSVILWARVVDPAVVGDITATLQVATDEGFSSLVSLDGGEGLAVTAEAAFDHCVKVRVTGLSAGTTYFYRVLYEAGGTTYSSRVGRTRTAPADDADTPVRLAIVSCQDYTGRYFNAWKRLADMDIDAVLHLGDYVYETTGDPSFQTAGSDRFVTFGDEAGAIAFNAGTDAEFYAAQSLDNYRDLYRTYRGDLDLQRAHERMPFIVIQDDHEFSDDCWGDTATYSDGREDELQPQRRLNADQAWFEYMPVDYPGDPTFRYDAGATFPDNLRIHRDLRFGKHVHVVMTDLRRFRSDHLVPEDAFPGALLLDQGRLEAALGAVPDLAVPYVDIDAHDGGSYATLLKDNADTLGFTAARIGGLMSVSWVNGHVETLNASRAPADAIAPIDGTGMDRGLAVHQTIKSSEFSMIGSRYLVVADPFDVYAAVLEAEGGTKEVMLGAAQKQWFVDTIKGSTATWKVWGNEFLLMPRKVDLTIVPGLPDAFRTAFWLSVEDWDGMPNRRQELLSEVGDVDNVVVVSGDLHSFWAGTPFAKADASKRLIEFAGGAISSGTYQTFLKDAAESDPVLKEAGADALAGVVTQFLRNKTLKTNPHLAFADLDKHGFMVAEADGERLEMTFHMLDKDFVAAPMAEEGEDLAAKFELVRFRVDAGQKDLFWDDAGTWKRWDTDAADWE